MLGIQVGLVTFFTLFQVLKVPMSFNLLLGRHWIHKVRAILSFFHQKMKFIHDGRVIMVRSSHDTAISFKAILEISHNDEDLFLIGFTFDEVQIIEIFDNPARDYLPLPFDEFGSRVVIRMMRSMNYLPNLGLGRRQQEVFDFVFDVERDLPFGLGFEPTHQDYIYVARLHQACLLA